MFSVPYIVEFFRRTTANLRSPVPPPIWLLYAIAALSYAWGLVSLFTGHYVIASINLVYAVFLVYTLRRK